MDARHLSSREAGYEERSELASRIASLIDAFALGSGDTIDRDTLLLDIARWQARHVPAYRRLLATRGIDATRAGTAADLPAMPTDVFRFTRVAAHAPEDDIQLFQTSGTTSGVRGQVHLCDLSLYDHSARTAAKAALFPDTPPGMTLISLISDSQESPDSSLAHMVARFQDWFGADDSAYVWQNGAIDYTLFETCLNEAGAQARPVCLLGTSFAFIFAEDAWHDRQWTLPPGSRIMQTGGFKGRTRTTEPAELRRLLAGRYGIADETIVAEYGMSELSSQLYENSLADHLSGRPLGPRRLKPPAWIRVVLCDPETLRPLQGDGPGLIRIEDVANLDTAWAVQTSDLGRRVEDGFELLGRAADAVLRGCSLSVEEALDRPTASGNRD